MEDRRDEAAAPLGPGELTGLFYDELRKLAEREMSHERRHHTLQPTALVHEAYLKLATLERVRWASRAHFLVAAAEAMRRVLVEHARRRGRRKRGGDLVRAALDEARLAAVDVDTDLEALDEALRALAAIDARKARIVEVRYFAGLSIEETAQHLSLSPATVKRDWEYARAWLHARLSEDRDDRSATTTR